MDAVAWRGCGRVTGNKESIEYGLMTDTFNFQEIEHQMGVSKMLNLDDGLEIMLLEDTM